MVSINNGLIGFHDKRKGFNMMKSCSCGVERDSEVSKLKLGRLGIAQIALGSRTLTIKIRTIVYFHSL